MILPERVLGRSGDDHDLRGLAIGPISWATCSRSSCTRTSPCALSSATCPRRMTKATIAWPVVASVRADDGRLGDRRVDDQRRLDLGGRDAVAGDVHHVVDAAEQPEVAVLVAAWRRRRRSTCRRNAPSRSPGSARGRPRCRAACPATARSARGSPPEPSGTGWPWSSTTSAPMPGQRTRRRAGLGRGDARQRRDHDRAGLGLPPGVDDRAAVAADVLVVPDPRLGVDRLADRAEQAQRARGRAAPGTRRPTS